ncbi:MAG: EAL domain-containing protein [Photobacterium frigidiphilum]|uniref:bifunctional diguanylate cyclase/phosphodiesterase n=1 Tax=Photobacterium frigidiphilum TaxID=264736 RepID=UPI0030015707
MTLYKQLTLGAIACSFTVCLILFMALCFSNTTVLKNQQENYIEQILSSNITVLTSIINRDIPQKEKTQLVESVLNSLLDQPMISSASFQVNSNSFDKNLTNNKQNNTSASVPAWFKFTFPINSLTVSKQRIDPFVTLTIATNSAYSYQQLWSKTLHSGYIAFVLFFVSLFLTIPLLTYGLRALKKITAYSARLQSGKPYQSISLPPQQDLRTIVKMMNQMHAHLEVNFKEQAHEAIKLRERAYRDEVSGLGNRTFFINELNSWLKKSHNGGLAIIKTTLIDDNYHNFGYESGDSLVKQIASKLNESIIYSDLILARLSIDEFAILVPNITVEKLKLMGETILSVVEKVQLDSSIQDEQSTRVGLLLNDIPTTTGTLLTQLDNALSKAAQDPQQPAVLVKGSQTETALGKQQWKSLLLESIANNYFVFHFQPVIFKAADIYHFEVLTSIKKGKEEFSAGQFLGALEDLGIGSLFDRHVIQDIIKKLNHNRKLGPLTVNLTYSSISDPTFIRWLGSLLQNNKALAGRLYFEIPESSFIRQPDATGLLCSAMQFNGFGFGVDNYGRHFKSLDYLNEFRPNYVKIDFAYTHQLNDQTKSDLLASISRTAHRLNIKTIATRVETETQLERLSELFVNGFQGYIIEKRNGVLVEKNMIGSSSAPNSIKML